MILLDGLHCGYAPNSLNAVQIGPFIEFSRLAAAGQKLMFVSHSSIIPPGYASTTETANFLIDRLGGRATKVRPRKGDPMGLELISVYSRGNFHVRGFSGNGKLDHCAHLGLYRDVLRIHVRPRWNSPGGRASSSSYPRAGRRRRRNRPDPRRSTAGPRSARAGRAESRRAELEPGPAPDPDRQGLHRREARHRSRVRRARRAAPQDRDARAGTRARRLPEGTIVYIDSHVVVVEKPSGVSSVPFSKTSATP